MTECLVSTSEPIGCLGVSELAVLCSKPIVPFCLVPISLGAGNSVAVVP